MKAVDGIDGYTGRHRDERTCNEPLLERNAIAQLACALAFFLRFFPNSIPPFAPPISCICARSHAQGFFACWFHSIVGHPFRTVSERHKVVAKHRANCPLPPPFRPPSQTQANPDLPRAIRPTHRRNISSVGNSLARGLGTATIGCYGRRSFDARVRNPTSSIFRSLRPPPRIHGIAEVRSGTG